MRCMCEWTNALENNSPGKKEPQSECVVYGWRLGIWNGWVAAASLTSLAKPGLDLFFPWNGATKKEMLFERLHETTHNNLLCRNTKRLSFGCAKCEWDAVSVLYEWRMTIHRHKVKANQPTHTCNWWWCLCHPGKKRAISRFFFRRCTQTYLALNQMRNAYIYIVLYESVRKVIAWSLHRASAAGSHFCDLLKRWYHVNLYGKATRTSTSCTKSSIPMSSSTRRWLLILIFNMYFPICWHRSTLSPL